MGFEREEDLYPPVKAFLERQGYEVKAEVNVCDLVACRGDEPPVIVELKTAFTLALVLQGVDRQAMSDEVYLGVGVSRSPAARSRWRRERRSILKLCRRLGLGLLVVHEAVDAGTPLVEPLLDPAPYRPRPDRRRTGRLLREFAHRVGDPNSGGVNRRPIVTAYRQDALRCAAVLAANGPASGAQLARATGVARATAIMYRDVYGWFERVRRGVYGLSPKGEAAVVTYEDVITELAGSTGANRARYSGR